MFCEAWNLSLWSSSSLKWNQALQARYSSSPKLFHTAKSKLLRHWTSTHPNPQVRASSSSLKPQPTQTHTTKSTSPSFIFITETSIHPNPHYKSTSENNTAKDRRVWLWVPSQHLSRNHDIDQVGLLISLWVSLGLLGFVGEEEFWLLEKKSLFLLREYWNRVCKARFQFKGNRFLRTRFQWQKTSLTDSISKSK